MVKKEKIITIIAHCWVCGLDTDIPVPEGEVDIKDGDRFDFLCARCREYLSVYAKESLKGRGNWGRHKAGQFLEVLCDEGNKFARELVKDLLNVKEVKDGKA